MPNPIFFLPEPDDENRYRPRSDCQKALITYERAWQQIKYSLAPYTKKTQALNDLKSLPYELSKGSGHLAVGASFLSATVIASPLIVTTPLYSRISIKYAIQGSGLWLVWSSGKITRGIVQICTASSLIVPSRCMSTCVKAGIKGLKRPPLPINPKNLHDKARIGYYTSMMNNQGKVASTKVCLPDDAVCHMLGFISYYERIPLQHVSRQMHAYIKQLNRPYKTRMAFTVGSQLSLGEEVYLFINLYKYRDSIPPSEMVSALNRKAPEWHSKLPIFNDLESAKSYARERSEPGDIPVTDERMPAVYYIQYLLDSEKETSLQQRQAHINPGIASTDPERCSREENYTMFKGERRQILQVFAATTYPFWKKSEWTDLTKVVKPNSK